MINKMKHINNIIKGLLFMTLPLSFSACREVEVIADDIYIPAMQLHKGCKIQQI